MGVRFVDCLIDTDRRELHRDGCSVPLEPQVFDLLVHLIRNRTHVVSKEDLVRSVWGGRIVSDATIHSRVKSARQAVGDSGAAQRVIRTIPRRGLRFVGEVIDEPPSPAEPVAAAPQRPATLEKPSIAVLAFANMSSAPGQEYVSEGIAEDIITALLRYPSLSVVACNSSFSYRGQIMNAKEVGRDLGVRYVLEGSVRKSGHRIRVTARLIDAGTGNHVWAEKYERKFSDLFALHDEIASTVTIAVVPEISNEEQKRAMRERTESLNSWTAYQRGLWHLRKGTAADNRMAQQLFQQAIDLDPAFAGGYRGLELSLFDAAIVYHEQELAAVLHSGEVLLRRVVELDPADTEAYVSLARVFTCKGDYEAALSEARRALAMNPKLASGHGALGAILTLSGHSQSGLESLRTCIILGPRDPFLHVRLMQVAMAHYFCRDYSAAVEAAKAALRSFPKFALPYLWLAAALAQTGLVSEAKDALAWVIATAPASIDLYVRRRVPWIRQTDYDHLQEGLHLAEWKG